MKEGIRATVPHSPLTGWTLLHAFVVGFVRLFVFISVWFLLKQGLPSAPLAGLELVVHIDQACFELTERLACFCLPTTRTEGVCQHLCLL